MKFLTIVLVSLLFSGVSFAFGGNKCPGICLNESGNSMYDQMCRVAGEARGRQGCQEYANLGCTYYQRQPVTRPGYCYNAGHNSQYDSFCSTVGANGKQGCTRYSNLGCSWVPSETLCQ